MSISTETTGSAPGRDPVRTEDVPVESLLVEVRRAAVATAVLGAVMVLLGAVTLGQAVLLDNEGQVVGPATAPYLVGSLTFVVGAILVLRGRHDVRRSAGDAAGATPPAPDWVRMGALVGVLVLFALLAPVLGYIVAATALFGATAVVLGMPDRLRAFVYGFIVATLVYLAFDVGIGIALPAAPWGF